MNFYSCDSPLKLDEVIRDYWELEREFGGMEDED
jgi:hypothetical protein